MVIPNTIKHKTKSGIRYRFIFASFIRWNLHSHISISRKVLSLLIKLFTIILKTINKYNVVKSMYLWLFKNKVNLKECTLWVYKKALLYYNKHVNRDYVHPKRTIIRGKHTKGVFYLWKESLLQEHLVKLVLSWY